MIQKTVWFIENKDLRNILASHCGEPKRGYKIIELKDGRKIFLKSFREKGLLGFIRNVFFPRGKKEFQVFKKLADLSIPTPLGFGYGVSRTGSFSVWEYLSGESYLEKFNTVGDRMPLIKMLAHFLKDLKLKGVRHDDLHLENIIISNDRPVLVDLHKVKVKKEINRKEEISNISHALHMVYNEMNEKEKETFFKFYGATDLREAVESKIEALREHWIKRKVKRAFRKTSIVSVKDCFRFIKGFEEITEGRYLLTLKKDKKVDVIRYENCVKKIYKSKMRLKKAWINSVVLEYMKLKITPQIFAARIPNFLSKGFILMEDLTEKGEELDRYLDGRYESLKYSERKFFLKRISTFFLEMLKHGVFHRDLKGCNVFVTADKTFYLLDVEDIEFKKVGIEDVVRMLTKLNNTIPKKIYVKDRLKFVASLRTFSKNEKREIWKRVAEKAKREEIVYEGTQGLIREKWES